MVSHCGLAHEWLRVLVRPSGMVCVLHGTAQGVRVTGFGRRMGEEVDRSPWAKCCQSLVVEIHLMLAGIMNLFDYTDQAASWLEAPSTSKAFSEWVRQAPPWVQVGFSGLGPVPGDDEWDELVEHRLSALGRIREPLSVLLEEGAWKQSVTWAIRRTEDLLGAHINQVDIVALVGLGTSNASQGFWGERGLAFLWLEHFLEPDSHSGYLDLGVDSIPIWLSHEIAHALRYSSPWTNSLLPQICSNLDPWLFWNTLNTLPLAERFLDEYLATAFSAAVVPDATESQVLGMSDMERTWLEENCGKLLRDRLEHWDFSAWDPPSAWIDESLGVHPDRLEPPWSLDRPPNRWGYFGGRNFSGSDPQGDWLRRLTQSYELP